MGNFFRNMPPVTRNILLINVIVYLAVLLLPRIEAPLVNLCALHYFTSQQFNIVQVVTYMFVHTTFMHLFFNMFALVMFGVVIERTFGSKRFLIYYGVCGVGAALIQLGVYALMIANYASQLPDGFTVKLISEVQVPANYMLATGNVAIDNIWALVNTPVIGASGAVYGILLAFGLLYPRQPLYLMFIPVPIQARWFVLGYAVIELLQGLSNNVGDNVAHFAHLGGMLFGLVLILYWRRKYKYRNY